MPRVFFGVSGRSGHGSFKQFFSGIPPVQRLLLSNKYSALAYLEMTIAQHGSMLPTFLSWPAQSPCNVQGLSHGSQLPCDFVAPGPLSDGVQGSDRASRAEPEPPFIVHFVSPFIAFHFSSPPFPSLSCISIRSCPCICLNFFHFPFVHVSSFWFISLHLSFHSSRCLPVCSFILLLLLSLHFFLNTPFMLLHLSVAVHFVLFLLFPSISRSVPFVSLHVHPLLASCPIISFNSCPFSSSLFCSCFISLHYPSCSSLVESLNFPSCHFLNVCAFPFMSEDGVRGPKSTQMGSCHTQQQKQQQQQQQQQQ